MAALAACLAAAGWPGAVPATAQPAGITLVVAAHHDDVRLLGAEASGELTFVRIHDGVPELQTKLPDADPTIVATLPPDHPVLYSAGHVAVLMLPTDASQDRTVTVYDVNTGVPTQYSYTSNAERLLTLASGGLVMQHVNDHTVWLWPAPGAPEVRLGALSGDVPAQRDAYPYEHAAADARGVVVTDGAVVRYFDFADAGNDATFARPRGAQVSHVWLSEHALAFTDGAAGDAGPYELLRADRGTTATTLVATSGSQFLFAAMSTTGTDYQLWPAPSGARAWYAHFVTVGGTAQETGVCSCNAVLPAESGGWYAGAIARAPTDAIAPGIWHVDDDAVAATPDPLPRTVIGYAPAYYSTASQANYVPADFTVTLTARPSADGFSCRIDGAAPAACPGQVAMHASDGAHDLHAFGTNDSGDGPVATAHVVVDGTPPRAAMTRPGSWTVAGSVPVAWSGSDTGSGVASYDVRYQTAIGTTDLGSYRYPSAWQHTTATSSSLAGSPGTEYCFGVRARDHVGNVSAWSARRCTAIPYDDRALTAATSGWARYTADDYFERTYTQSTTYGAVLTHGAVTADRIALLATHCATCGAVWISVGGHVVAKIDLHASSTARMLTSVAFPTVSGSVSIRVVSSAGRLVRLDAVGFRRT
jgi:hypothetical protein